MRLQELDLHRLIRACELYKERTGSESDEYEDLIRKIKHYLEENWTDA
jgi:VanZ family protein